MTISELMRDTDIGVPTDTDDNKSSIVHLLYRDPERMDVVIMPFSLNPLEWQEEIYYIQFIPGGTPFTFWQDAKLLQCRLPNNDKYLFIQDEKGDVVLPYRSRRFPQIIMPTNFYTQLEDGYERHDHEESPDAFKNPFGHLREQLEQAFEDTYADSSPLFPYHRLPRHSKAQEASEFLLNPQTITCDPFKFLRRYAFPNPPSARVDLTEALKSFHLYLIRFFDKKLYIPSFPEF